MVDAVESSLAPPMPARAWDVAALVQAVADALTARFAVCHVRGEISGFSRAASGHCYFNLKDADGRSTTIRCVMFRRAAGLRDFDPGEGQLVEVRGRVAVYEPRGELQFVVEAIAHAGVGALFEQFLRLKRKLETEGLFDSARKRTPPAFPRRVGVITSLGAAALHDVASVFARRAPHIGLVVYPSLVQGVDAPASLVNAIQLAGQRAEVDSLIICRGGGSLEDLWAFNDERVVRSIVASPLPVLCGVGHESDVTLADLAADLRAPTPTAAAEMAAPQCAELLRQLSNHAQRLSRAVGHRIDTTHQYLDRIGARLARPTERMGRERIRLALLHRRLPQAVAAVLRAQRDLLAQSKAKLMHAGTLSRARLKHTEQQLATRLHALDPLQVVARGYALIHANDGQLVVAAEQIHAGDKLRLTLARGPAEVTVAPTRTNL